MTRTAASVATITVAMAVIIPAQSPSTDPVDGTWRINPTRSTYSPGPPPPPMITQLRRFSSLGDDWHLFELTSINAQSEPVFQSAAFRIDGKQYPVYTNAALAAFLRSGTPTPITRSWRRIDARTTEFTTYTNGVPGLAIVRAVSSDGQTYTETSKGTDAQGRAIDNVIVFDRVR